MISTRITLMLILFCFSLAVAVSISKSEPEARKSTIYTVKCVDDILTGEFVKVNDKYFRPNSTEPTWVPLAQCSLEPKVGK